MAAIHKSEEEFPNKTPSVAVILPCYRGSWCTKFRAKIKRKEKETCPPCPVIPVPVPFHSALHDSDLLLLGLDHVQSNLRIERRPLIPSLPNILTVLWRWAGPT